MTRVGPWRLAVLALLGLCASASADQQLILGTVPLRLGESEATAVKALSRDYKVERIPGGWSIEPRARKPSGPAVGIRTLDGVIESVSLVWGPGPTPSAGELAVQLAEALPLRGTCEVVTISRAQEGGRVRTMEWSCGDYGVRLVGGTHAQGDTVAITLRRLRK
jgi:hypothetical protein